jgi:hypothetical protein
MTEPIDFKKEQMKRFVQELADGIEAHLAPKLNAQEKMLDAMIATNLGPHDLSDAVITSLFEVLIDGFGMSVGEITDMLGHNVGYTAMVRSRK